MSNKVASSNLENAIALYNQYHNPDALSEESKEEIKENKKPEWFERISAVSAQVMKRLTQEEIINAQDAETIQNTLNDTLMQWAADDKKTALLNLLTSVGVPLLLQYFLGKYNKQQSAGGN